MEYKLTKKRHLLIVLSSFGISILGCAVLPIYCFYNNYSEAQSILNFSFIFLLIIITPTLILHLNYYFASRKLSVFIDYISEKISVNESGIESTYHFNDIKMILIVRAEARARKLPWSDYGYIKIGIPGRTPILITSLMANIQDVQFKNTSTIFEFFPLL